MTSVLAIGTLACAAVQPTPVAAQSDPYGFEVERSLVTGALVASALVLRQFVLDPTPVGPGDFDRAYEGPGFDALATDNYSPGWRAWTDRLLVGLWAGALGAAVVPGVSDHGSLGTNLRMFGETALITVGTTEVLKRAVARHRPYTYNTELDDETIAQMVGSDSTDARASFPSGHSSMAFAAATFTASVLTTSYDWSTSVDATVWAVTLGAATATAIGRVQAGKHFPSDVIIGAVLGSAVGMLVPSCQEFGTGFCDLRRMQEGQATVQLGLFSIPFG